MQKDNPQVRKQMNPSKIYKIALEILGMKATQQYIRADLVPTEHLVLEDFRIVLPLRV